MIDLTIEDAIARVVLDAPKKLNSLDEAALDDLAAADRDQVRRAPDRAAEVRRAARAPDGGAQVRRAAGRVLSGRRDEHRRARRRAEAA